MHLNQEEIRHFNQVFQVKVPQTQENGDLLKVIHQINDQDLGGNFGLWLHFWGRRVSSIQGSWGIQYLLRVFEKKITEHEFSIIFSIVSLVFYLISGYLRATPGSTQG